MSPGFFQNKVSNQEITGDANGELTAASFNALPEKGAALWADFQQPVYPDRSLILLKEIESVEDYLSWDATVLYNSIYAQLVSQRDYADIRAFDSPDNASPIDPFNPVEYPSFQLLRFITEEEWSIRPNSVVKLGQVLIDFDHHLYEVTALEENDYQQSNRTRMVTQRVTDTKIQAIYPDGLVAADVQGGPIISVVVTPAEAGRSLYTCTVTGGYNIEYKWQFRFGEGSAWQNRGGADTYMTHRYNYSRSDWLAANYQARCLVTSGDGSQRASNIIKD